MPSQFNRVIKYDTFRCYMVRGLAYLTEVTASVLQYDCRELATYLSLFQLSLSLGSELHTVSDQVQNMQEADRLEERIILPEHILLAVFSSNDLKVQLVLDRSYTCSTVCNKSPLSYCVSKSSQHI